jgi:hypothetical protein
MQKPDLRPTDGADPNHVTVAETVMQLGDERYWLYAPVDSDTDRPAPNPTSSDEITGANRDIPL